MFIRNPITFLKPKPAARLGSTKSGGSLWLKRLPPLLLLLAFLSACAPGEAPPPGYLRHLQSCPLYNPADGWGGCFVGLSGSWVPQESGGYFALAIGSNRGCCWLRVSGSYLARLLDRHWQPDPGRLWD